MKRQPRPSLGTTMFCVQEHLYYIPGRAGPAKEYAIFEGQVAGYYDGPGWTDIELHGRGANGAKTIRRRLKDIGTKVFYTAVEAARLAQEMTEDYERRWAWTERWGDIPLRRPWAGLLMKTPALFFFIWPRNWWELKGEDALLPAEDSFREAKEKAFQESGFRSHAECEEWNRVEQARRGIAHTNKGYYGPKKVAGPGHSGPVASNYRSTCPYYLGYYLGGNPLGSWTECQLGGLMTGAAWYEYCGKAPTACPMLEKS